jgi:hypothetical protein
MERNLHAMMGFPSIPGRIAANSKTSHCRRNGKNKETKIPIGQKNKF